MRNGKPFRPADLAVYGVIAVVIAALFLAFAVFKREGDATEIIAESNGERVFVYSFADGSLILNENFSGLVAKDVKDGVYTVVIYTDKEKTAFNTVIIERDGTTYVSDADCSRRKDCTHMKAIDESGGTIVCVPHGLKIYATGDYSPTLG